MGPQGQITIGRCWSLSLHGTIGTKRHRQLLERLGSQDRQSDSRSRTAGTNHHRHLLESFSIWDRRNNHHRPLLESFSIWDHRNKTPSATAGAARLSGSMECFSIWDRRNNQHRPLLESLYVHIGTIGAKRHRQLLERLGSQEQWSDSRSRTVGTNYHRRMESLKWSLSPHGTTGTITIGRCWSLSTYGTIETKRHRPLLERLGTQDRLMK